MELAMVKLIGIFCLIFYLVFLILLVINLNRKNRIVKGIFAILIIVFLGILLHSNESVLDSVLALIVRYIYFPSFATFMLIVLGSLVILLYSVFNDKLPNKMRIINYVFASWIIIDYIIFILLKLDVTSYIDLYTDTSLICLRLVTRGFLLWILTIINMKVYYSYMNDENRGA
jgi:hypothetical protein